MFANKLISNLTKYCKNYKKINFPRNFSFPSKFTLRGVYLQKKNATPIFNRFQQPLILCNAKEFARNKTTFAKCSDEKCWRCNQYLERKNLTCKQCGALKPPKENINYFELLGVSQSYDVNMEDLALKFKNLQKVFHPDKFANKSKEEQDISEKYSRLINKAYATLKDPVLRGIYLLDLQKLPIDSNYPLEQDFLMSVMEKNEELESLDSKFKLEKFFKVNEEEVKKYIMKTSEAFRHSNFNDAKVQLLKLKYYVNIEKKVKGRLADFTAKNT